jgi:hypothetical protein
LVHFNSAEAAVAPIAAGKLNSANMEPELTDGFFVCSKEMAPARSD